MSISIALGVDSIDGPTMVQARRHWDDWVVDERPLVLVGGLLHLRAWTRAADAGAKDDALRALAKIGSATGRNDPAAITALVWALVPGASILAHRMSDLADDIDELVAGHLWIAAKTFAWNRRRSVAASILRDTARGIQADLGVGEGARRQDRAWTQTFCVEPSSPSWQRVVVPDDHRDSAAELMQLMDAALREGVITDDDRSVLIELALASDTAGLPAGRGRAGLMTPSATDVVALKWGVSSRTIRRRAAGAIDRLAEFSRSWLDAEGPGSDHDEFRLSA